MDRENRKRASNDFQKQTGEEPEPEDSPPGSQKREFQQVTKSEPKGISAWGLRHPLLLVEIYSYTPGIGGKRQGTWVLAGSKIGQNLIGYIATRFAGPKWWEGLYPYTTGIGGKRQGTCVLEATKIGPNLIGNIATRSAGPKSVGGAAPASAVAGYDISPLGYLHGIDI